MALLSDPTYLALVADFAAPGDFSIGTAANPTQGSRLFFAAFADSFSFLTTLGVPAGQLHSVTLSG